MKQKKHKKISFRKYIFLASISTGFNLNPIAFAASCGTGDDWSVDNQSCHYIITNGNTNVKNIKADGNNAILTIDTNLPGIPNIIGVSNNTSYPNTGYLLTATNGGTIDIRAGQFDTNINLSYAVDDAVFISTGGVIKVNGYINSGSSTTFKNGFLITDNDSLLESKMLDISTKEGHALKISNNAEVIVSQLISFTGENQLSNGLTIGEVVLIESGGTLGTATDLTRKQDVSKIISKNGGNVLKITGSNSQYINNFETKLTSTNGTNGSIGLQILDKATFTNNKDAHLIILFADLGLYISDAKLEGGGLQIRGNHGVKIEQNATIDAASLNLNTQKTGVSIDSSIFNIGVLNGSINISTPYDKAIHINNNSTANIKSSLINIYGDQSYGVYLENNSKYISANNNGTAITTYGSESVGFFISGPTSFADLPGELRIGSNGKNSHGIFVGDGATFTIGRNLNLFNNGATDISSSTLAGCGPSTSICITGNNSSIISNYNSPDLYQENNISATGNAIKAYDGADINIELSRNSIYSSSNTLPTLEFINITGNSSLKIINSNLNSSNNRAISVTDSNLLSSSFTRTDLNGSITLENSTFTLLADDSSYFTGNWDLLNQSKFESTLKSSRLRSDITLDINSQLDLNLLNESTFAGSIKPNSTTTSLTNTIVNIDSDSYWNVLDSSAISHLNNSGTVEFDEPSSSSISENYKNITLNNYIGNNGNNGNNGNLIINTYVEQTGSPSDQIILNNGGSASGNTAIYVNKRGGLGAETTGKGILIINANNNATTSIDSFSLGQAVTAGGYNYQLYRNNDQSWYLTTSINPNPSPLPDPQPDYSEEVYVVASLPSLAQYYGLTTLGSRRERVGFDSLKKNSKNSIFWGRMSHSNGKHNGGFKYTPEINNVAYTPNYNYNINFLQIGADLLNLRKHNSDIKSGLFLQQEL